MTSKQDLRIRLAFQNMPFGARLFSFPDHNYTPDDIAENLEKLIDRLRDVAKQHDEMVTKSSTTVGSKSTSATF